MIGSWRIVMMTLGLGTAALGSGGEAGGTQGPATPPPALFSRLSEAERQLLLAATDITDSTGFQPGRVPAGLPFPNPTLPGQTVVGTVTQPGSGIQVIWRSTLAPAQAQAQIMQALRAAGWQDQFPRGSMVEVFQSAPVAGESVMPLCKPSVRGQLTAMALPRAEGGSQISFGYEPQGSGCPVTMPPQDNREANFYSFSYSGDVDPLQDLKKQGALFPQLLPPVNSSIENTGSTMGSNEYTAYAKVFSSNTASQIRDEYVNQLRAQGWTVVGSVNLGPELVTRLTAPAKGKSQTATFFLMPRPDAPAREPGTKLNRYDLKFELILR